jgi:Holliday junction resolvase-like predicted endonuclease
MAGLSIEASFHELCSKLRLYWNLLEHHHILNASGGWTPVTEDEQMQRIKAEIVATAAEAFAAAQFARFGYDVSVQYGANQPEYDLIIAEGWRMLKISVKGSADGGWNLTQSAQSDLSTANRANCHDAADLWLARHKAGTAICLVQLKDVVDDALPRLSGVAAGDRSEIEGRCQCTSKHEK